MENVYDLHQHSDCAIIYMGRKNTCAYLCPNLSRSSSNSKNIIINKNRIIYNKERTKILNWGDAYYENEDKDVVQVENFRDELYNIFKTENNQWDEDDKFLLLAVSDFIHCTIKATMESHKTEITTMNAIHYAFVIPSVWDEYIAKVMIRSIFIQSNLISKDDNNDRLLFFTDIESIFYGFDELNHQGYSFKRGQNTILSQLSLFENSTVSVKLDLLSTMNTRFDFDDSKLFPKVVRSMSLVFTFEDIKDSIKSFFESKLFPGGMNADQDRVMEMVAAFKFDIGSYLTKDRYDKFEYDEHPFYENDEDEDDDKYEFYQDDDNSKDVILAADCTFSKRRWRLNETQKAYIRSVGPHELCEEISKPLLESLKNLISYNTVKKYEFLVLQDSYSSSFTYIHSQALRNFSLLSWLKMMLERNRVDLNSMTTVVDPRLNLNPISLGDIVSGASLGVIENVKNSDINCKPRIVPTEDSTLSSMCFNARPNAIINIDISYKSTLLTCSILNDDGLVKEILNHDYFIAEKCLPSLDYFYDILNETTLNVKYRFIPFAETYSLNDSNFFSVDNDASVKKEVVREVEAILNENFIEKETSVVLRHRDHFNAFLRTYKDYIKKSMFKKVGLNQKSLSFSEGTLVSIKQRKYIKAFLGMYMVYLKEIVSSKLPVHLQYEGMKTGFAVSIEKMVLDNVIGTRKDFEKIVFESGLVQKDDEFQKLRIITQGEGLLPFIQQSLKLGFPLKSYFVLAQLHEEHIQLTLHQVVTDSSLEGQLEAIIFHDEIIYIRNIYDDLCLNMWNNFIQNNQLIQSCKEHTTSNGSVTSELFSLKTKNEFVNNLKWYISNSILGENSTTKSKEKTSIYLTKSCSCSVHLTDYDILEVSFRPVLQNITCVISTSLINKDIFGNYPFIKYLFNLIHFNRNSQLQGILANMFKEEAEDFNSEQGIETTFFTIPELPHIILRPILNQQPLLYRAFQMGTLHHVFSNDYSFSIGYTPVGAVKFFAIQSVDTESYVIKNDIAFSLLKKGGVISNTQSNKIFYFMTDEYSCPRKINIGIQKLKEFKGLEYEQFDLFDTAYETIYSRIIYFKKSRVENGNLPIMVSVKYQGHCSSLKLSITTLDKDINIPNFLQVGEPMTLKRF
ncbi:hypothetical protein BDF21DRAFT_425466 [Thamnidium elegans]|nr:hypothetical protein BDF21DRAFT_425466 [Thamnidium elegans]